MEVNEKNNFKNPDAKEIWKKCLSLIKENVPALTYSTWFIPIKPFSYSEDVLKIEVPNDFFIEWIDEHYNTVINNVVRQVLGENGKLIYLIGKEGDSQYDVPGTVEEVVPKKSVHTVEIEQK